MNNPLSVASCLRLIFLSALLVGHPRGMAYALEKPAEELMEVQLDTKLGETVVADLDFTESTGRSVKIREYFGKDRPIILVPVYYDCPKLCGLLLSGVRKLINELDLLMGKDYSVVTVSFDSRESYQLAAERKVQQINQLDPSKQDAIGWHFLVGDEINVKALMNQIGFHFKEDKGEFAHTATIIILTPEGKISQYFTGIQFKRFDLKLALVEASAGRIGSPLDHILLFCFRFDPTKGRYTWAVLNLVRVGGILTLLALSFLLYRLWRREIVHNLN